MKIVEWQELILFIASTFFLDFTNLIFYNPKNINKVVVERKDTQNCRRIMAAIVHR